MYKAVFTLSCLGATVTATQLTSTLSDSTAAGADIKQKIDQQFLAELQTQIDEEALAQINEEAPDNL